MKLSRQYVLGVLLVFSALVAAALLAGVLSTVFFAITVAYLLLPVHRRLIDRGLSPRLASAVATLAVFVGTLAVTTPLVLILVVRLDSVLAVLEALPDNLAVELFGFVYMITLDELLTVAISYGRAIATAAAGAAPVLLIKLTLFGLLVFSLLLNERDSRSGMLALVPPEYRDVAIALNRRTRETLFAIYVLQAATAVGTFIIALPVFFLLGYDFPLTLATIAAILQFIPIVGPSVLLIGLAAWHALTGQMVQAALVFVVGGLLIAWLPDILIRPRLAQETANLPGSLYFVGFVGGLLSLGPVGVIAGPLVVALVVELADLLADELRENTDAPAALGASDAVEATDVDDVTDATDVSGPTDSTN